VPASVAVPSLLFVRVTTPGKAPVSVIAMLALVGKPVVVIVNVPALPTVKVVLFALVMEGASSTFRVKACVASVRHHCGR